MGDSFLKKQSSAPPSGGFVTNSQPQQQFNQGNPYPPQQQGGNYYDPRYAMTADMIYREIGYRDGNPTEIDIFSDLLNGTAPVERFLVGDGWNEGDGLSILAHFFSKLLDYKLVSFFKDFRLSIVQDADGAMFIAPAPEQTSERGKELALTTIAEVSAEMNMISQNLQTNLLESANRKLASHREAAKIIAQQGGITALLDEAAGGGGKGGPGVVSSALNFGLRTLGVPVGPPQGSQPPPPPGR